MGNQQVEVGASLCPVCLGAACGHFSVDEIRIISEFGWRSWAEICCEDSSGITAGAPVPRKTTSGWPK
jgi:hypothetical protein